MAEKKFRADTNADPITNTPGSHPVATGVGTALGGAVAGVAAGAVAGPVGAAVGAIVGGVAGGAAGTIAGEELDPTQEEAYWRDNYSSRPYFSEDVPYDTISPAYRYGWEARSRYSNAKFEDVESKLEQGWEETKHDVRLGWEQARNAAHDAWDHAAVRKPR